MIKTNIKQLPLSERPYEKCLKYGASNLSDAELLAVIIRTGTKKENSIQLASRVINEIPGKKISGLFQMSVAQLVDIHGIGNAKGRERRHFPFRANLLFIGFGSASIPKRGSAAYCAGLSCWER